MAAKNRTNDKIRGLAYSAVVAHDQKVTERALSLLSTPFSLLLLPENRLHSGAQHAGGGAERGRQGGLHVTGRCEKLRLL